MRIVEIVGNSVMLFGIMRYYHQVVIMGCYLVIMGSIKTLFLLHKDPCFALHIHIVFDECFYDISKAQYHRFSKFCTLIRHTPSYVL